MNSPVGSQPPGMNELPQTSISGTEQEIVFRLINDLANPSIRKNALLELSKRRETISDLGVILWHSFGTVAILLQEIITVYPLINPPALSTTQSNTACNALALLQCIASHPETRHSFLLANIHRFIYPLLEIVPKSRAVEYLKLTGLGVIGALVKTDEEDVMNFLLSSEIIPYCLRNMEFGSELSKTVATFILQRILSFENGLNYVCQTYERFSHVATILGKMVLCLANEQPSNLLRHVIRIYLRLTENPRAREALCQCLPEQMRDNSFLQFLKEDDTAARSWLSQLHQNLKNVSANTNYQCQYHFRCPYQCQYKMNACHL